MKEKYCIVKYNENSRKWNLILETSKVKDFLEFNSEVKCFKKAKTLSIMYKVLLYVYDRDDKLIQKNSYL